MGYALLSRYYDEIARFDYKGYLDFLLDRLPQGRGLDLACGSGKLTAMLASAGREMTGMDNSSQMLTLAAARARKERRKVLFIDGDLNLLEISKSYNFIISSCDGFNYVKSEALLKDVFKKSYGALQRGGVLAFDVSTLKKADYLDGNVFFEDTDDYTLLWTNKRTGNRVDTEVTVFERKGQYYVREDEASEQYFYGLEFIKKSLEECGFKAEFFDGESFKEFNGGSHRLLAVAIK